MTNHNRENTDLPKFEEQDAPLKNTDHAFVQVKEDGSPYMPGKDQKGVSSTATGNRAKPEEGSDKNSR
jgi:hypothetical protein